MKEGLVVFDVDGTLCDTSSVDEECFLSACADWLGEDVRQLDWTVAPQITDQGILEWLWLELLERPPSPTEVLAVKKRFVLRLKDTCARFPGRFRAMPGAADLFRSPQLESWELVAATGGWKEAALVKLKAAGLPTAILTASSNDTADRAQVFRLAASTVSVSKSFHGRVVLVGDGVWDARVACELGWTFVGVGTGDKAHRLRAAGAREVVQNFTDLGAFCRALRGSEAAEGYDAG